MNRKSLAATAFACLCMLANTVNAVGNQRIAKPYDWTVELKTGSLPNQFDYANSRLHGIEKVRVAYIHTEDSAHSDPQPQNYENLWYHDGRPLGLQREHHFDVTQGDGVSILVSHKDGHGSQKEYKAAANAILRLLVDSYLNKNAVVSVRLPEDSFDGIAQELQNQGCLQDPTHVDDPGGLASAVSIFLQTEPDATRTLTLYYL